MTPQQLSAQNYTAADSTRVHDAMTTLMRELTATLDAHAPDGTWQPQSHDEMAQLAEVDDTLAQLYRALGTARRAISAVDRQAASRLLRVK